MKLLAVIFAVSFLWNENSFIVQYKHKIEKADIYFNELSNDIKASAVKYETDYHLISAIVYPELIRYSMFEDYFVIKALEALYIQGGCGMADFSIGKFQMKPSFAEKLEQIVTTYPKVFKDCTNISSFDSENIFKIRSERLERLKSEQWQIIYLNCFFTVLEKRYNDMVFENNLQKLRFYSTAYNHGFDKNKDEIKKYSHKNCFPDACDCESLQYNYADISVYFYKRIINNE